MTSRDSQKNTSTSRRIRLRLYYDFEKPRNGREIIIAAAEENDRDQNQSAIRASLSTIKDAIESQLDLRTHIPHVYSSVAECFVPLSNIQYDSIEAEQYVPTPTDNSYSRSKLQTIVEENDELEKRKKISEMPRIDVKLISCNNNESIVGDIAKKLICDSSNTSLTSTWFGIGILRGKVNANHGSLWRSALQFGASLTFTIGKRYEKRAEGNADVYKTLRQIPCIPFIDIASFMATTPVDAKIVVIEYGGENLTTFKHPKRALYVLGSEDAGVPPALVARAHAHIAIPTVPGRPASLNVAAAGAIVMYDRFIKHKGEFQDSNMLKVQEQNKIATKVTEDIKTYQINESLRECGEVTKQVDPVDINITTGEISNTNDKDIGAVTD